ncbi:MAG: helix-turn-helix domain-containing protein, partial [Azonexus sp.]|nr:helix-turn-helix domain-containing protein [Azonexus sp.]
IGGPSSVAREVGETTQADCFWRDGKRRIPAAACPSNEKATGGAVRCEDLRPDVDWAYLRSTEMKAA